MTIDEELDLWRKNWQSQPDFFTPVTPRTFADLRQRIQRDSHRTRVALISAVIITLLLSGVTVAFEIGDPGFDSKALAAAVMLFLSGGWIVGIVGFFMWKGKWSAGSTSTNDFLKISTQRCRASLRANSFGALLITCEFIFITGWIYHHISTRIALPISPFLVSMPMIAILVAAMAVFVFFSRHRTSKKAELDCLSVLQKEYRDMAGDISDQDRLDRDGVRTKSFIIRSLRLSVLKAFRPNGRGSFVRRRSKRRRLS